MSIHRKKEKKEKEIHLRNRHGKKEVKIFLINQNHCQPDPTPISTIPTWHLVLFCYFHRFGADYIHRDRVY